MKAFEDPMNEGNGTAYHTGKSCIEEGCDRPAGTAWSPSWCFECNVIRIRRIDEQLAQIERQQKAKRIGAELPMADQRLRATGGDMKTCEECSGIGLVECDVCQGNQDEEC